MNKKIAEVGLTHEPRPLRQNHVIIHSGDVSYASTIVPSASRMLTESTNLTSTLTVW
jgi:hypothetical protein